MADIQKISHTHDLLMDWLLENPERPLRDCALYFGYTQAWVSTIIHSDIFQAKLSERQGEIFAQVAQDIPSKLRATAGMALEKLAAAVEHSEDPEFLLSAADKTLHRLGYAPSSGRSPGAVQVNQQNNFFVQKDDLKQLRAGMLVKAEIVEVPAIENSLPSTD